MQNDIEVKLQKALSKRSYPEERVVYILVETRKLLEHDGEPPAYRWLKFFCDWALHIKMERSSAQKFLRLCDDALESIKDPGATPPAGVAVERLPTDNTFRRLLVQLLKRHSIHFNQLRWADFLKGYVRVIKDCHVKQNRSTTLRHLDEVVVSAYRPMIRFKNQAFKMAMKWSFRKAGVEVRAYRKAFLYDKPNQEATVGGR